MRRSGKCTRKAHRRVGIPRNADAGFDGVRNLQDMSVDELIEEFGVTREQVQAVLQFAAHSAEAPPLG